MSSVAKTKEKVKKFFLSISVKLFFTFWLVIITSVLISYLVTKQFWHSPTQEQADPAQVKILAQYSASLSNKRHVKLRVVQDVFYRKYQQYLFIKNLETNKLHSPKKRLWSKVHHYIKRHALDNPVTIDFSFTQVTTSRPVLINGERMQLLIANKPNRKLLTRWVTQLPITIRLFMLLTISFLSCWLLAKSFGKPLIAIQKASEDIGQGKLNTRIDEFDKRTDEFGALARSFNNMAEQLENNMSSHQRLLGDVSHELRSPLTRLQLAVALAEKNIGKTDEQRKHLTRCETEVERIDEMLGDVLTLSRLEHSHKTFTAEDTIELNQLVEQIINDCQYYANSKNVKINIQSKVFVTLQVDVKLLASAISNILNNAVKYSPNEQTVNVSLKQNDKKISLCVSDQGPGVPSDMIEKLFTPFFRVAESRNRKSGGTGLGLAIAQQAIHLHGGEIFAENREPNGLSVTIILPVSLDS